MYESIEEIRNAFWKAHVKLRPYRRKTRINHFDYELEVRERFNHWINFCYRQKMINKKQFDNATL